MEAEESPRIAAEREIAEEIGLAITVLRLLIVEYQSAYGGTSESLQFIFDGGTLTQAHIDQIKLPADELSEWRMLPLAIAIELLAPKLSERIQIAYKNLSQTLYLEDGVASLL